MATLAHAMWTHGHSLASLQSATEGVILHLDSCGRYQGLSNCLYFAIPTPVIVNGGRLRVKEAIIRFRCRPNGSKITKIEVYDGEKRIAFSPTLNLFPTNWNVYRLPVAGTPEVKYGISINVSFVFKRTLPDQVGWVDFSSVGCDFLPPKLPPP